MKRAIGFPLRGSCCVAGPSPERIGSDVSTAATTGAHARSGAIAVAKQISAP